MGWNEGILDAVLVPLGLSAMVGYHIWLYMQIRRKPMHTVVGVNHMNRRAWVKSIMKDVEKKNILAVQTLRNSIMASTLLASTAILLASGIAAFVSATSSQTVEQSLHGIIVGTENTAAVTVKFLSVLCCFLFAFFCHMQAIRYLNHVNFLINIPVGPDAPGLTPNYVATVLEKGSDFYTIGTRGYYFAFPLLLWLFGPIPMCVSCFLFVPLLFSLDRAGSTSRTLHRPSRGDDGAASPSHACVDMTRLDPNQGRNVASIARPK